MADGGWRATLATADNSRTMQPSPPADPPPGTRSNLYGLGRDALAEILGELSQPAYRARQLFRALYHGDRLDPERWLEFPRDLRAGIAREFSVARPRVSARTDSTDGTSRFLLELPGGDRVEAVSIPADDRMTFCISSQVGCAYGCTFCMTARLGFGRHLLAGEIAGQVAALMEATGTAHGRYNIVFMGMGEPLHNLAGVTQALSILFDEEGFALGPRRVTVSTVGLVNGIRALAALPIVPRLAVSLVAADQAVRERLMPVARSVPVDVLADAVREYGEGKRDRPTFECVMLKDVNDRPTDARALAELALRADAKVNLIEFNPTPELPFDASTEASIRRVLRTLADAGVTATVRRSRGKDIDAACGQLAFSERAARSG